MLVLLPSGTEQPFRAARVTLALIGVNVLVFLLSSPNEGARLAEHEAELERIAEWMSPGRYVTGREFAAAGLAELLELEEFIPPA